MISNADPLGERVKPYNLNSPTSEITKTFPVWISNSAHPLHPWDLARKGQPLPGRGIKCSGVTLDMGVKNLELFIWNRNFNVLL